MKGVILMDLYRKYEALSPIYRGGLTNHLPMVLTVLENMGIETEVITRKLDAYKDVKGLYDLTDNNTPMDDFNQNYINRTGFYLGELNRKGEDIVIGEFINLSKFNISSALFHGLIRLAYAKQAHHPLMIAQALAYFEVTSDKIDFDARFESEEEFIKIHNKVVEDLKKSDFKFESNSTMEKFQELLTHDEVSSCLVYLKKPKKEFILDFILSYYQATKDFYILHLITGFEALLELEEYLFDFEAVLNHFFAIAQVFVLFNTEINIEDKNPEKDIEELKNDISDLIDFHDIKLFYSLYKLNKSFENKKISWIANYLFDKQ